MRFILFSLSLLFFISCKTETAQKLTNISDYDEYLAVSKIDTTSKYFEIWNKKIEADSSQFLSFGIVAGEYNRYFKNTGDIKFLKKAEKSLKKAVDVANIGKSGYLRALARNYISQHRFREALVLADSARYIGSGVKESQALLFDIHIELGNYDVAKKYLDSTENLSSFGYLIRVAKWNDYKGDLDTTIRFMEKAMAKAESSKNKNLLIWSYTNLADYYGHAGRIEDSYNHYLKTLQLDPKNAYAKKGIAWIVFSHEKNPQEALRILDAVTKNNKAPDYLLLKSEIAEYMGNELASIEYMEEYFKVIKDNSLYHMYSAYTIPLYLDITEQYNKALVLAKQEVANRATPEAYSLLANTYLKLGEIDMALQITDEHIADKTFEPAILYRAAEVYRAAGETGKVATIKKELVGAFYELGPIMENKIVSL
ncbi:hypothetical protein JQC67_15950 [Aurantibacter crassamenti]|uniref:tetratricopeptide repeat protein n=1 Tax=Aurantibacter crassamenti TaxID=1837375 RepID=UPI00193AC2E9|nr:hypothetical protein [Aurantibacter crassamenti]MBM1107650.1 hypothetical protein [Aurantibacter crassamenti]